MPEYVTNLGNTLLSNLGSFWSSVFGGQSQLTAISDAQVQVYEQTLINAAEALASVSRFEIPVFHSKQWEKLVVSEDAVWQATNQPYVFGDSINFGSAVVFGQAKDTGTWRIPVSGEIESIRQICDRPIKPLVVWTAGVDFTYNPTTKQIETQLNPFEAGFQVDENGTLSLWLNDLEIDTHLLYNHFGYAIDLYAAKSSENYKNLINAVFNALMQAGDRLSIQTAVASIVGIPVVNTDGEVVESIEYNLTSTDIKTSKYTYQYPIDCTALVDVGDVVNRGDILVDAVQIYENEQIKQADVDGLYVQPAFDIPGLTGPLFFDNQLHSINFSTDEDGFAVVTFPVSGRAVDVDAFWNEVYRRSKHTGLSVAQAVRTQPGSGQPVYAQVAPRVNPLHFLLDFVVPGNVTLVRLKSTGNLLLENSSNLVFLRKVTPAHTALLFDVSVSLDVESGPTIIDNLDSYNAFPNPGANLFSLVDFGTMTESLNPGTINELTPSIIYV